MEALVQHLIELGVLRAPEYIEAFQSIDRKDFVLPEHVPDAYGDFPLPIGFGQTISQPYTVAFMIELLEPRKGDRVLDVGSGSGWTTALLAHIVGESGTVFGVERVPELVEFGQKNLKKYRLPHVEICFAGKKIGLPEKGTFHRILVSAAGREIPEEFIQQLKTWGALVIPVDNAIIKVTKLTHGNIKEERFEGFSFVPLIRK